MTPEEFVRTWSETNLLESQGAQSHFQDLCRLLGIKMPQEADIAGETYCFERRVAQIDGRTGWADVWHKDYFAWEYKSPGEDLDKAFAQLQRYAPALGNPPLLIVSDLRHIRIHTNWTYLVSQKHDIGPTDLLDPDKRKILNWALSEPERLRPGQTRAMLTEQVAARFATLADRLRRRGYDQWNVAHFLMRLVFCMFAKDVGLLDKKLFTDLLDEAAHEPDEFVSLAEGLFRTMSKGGRFGIKKVEWFNGGLFEDSTAIPLEPEDLLLVREAGRLDWADIDPTILGTLFERGLSPERRTAMARDVVRRDKHGRSKGAVGVYYTPEAMILRLVEPVVTRPLRRKWEHIRGHIIALLDVANGKRKSSVRKRAQRRAKQLYDAFLNRLHRVRVLDPACGSGNFLYLALRELKDLEHEVHVDGENYGFPRQHEFDLTGKSRPRTIGPEVLIGIELNPMGVELARISVWIGFIQWMIRHGEDVRRNPVLPNLERIEQKDALIDLIGGEQRWLEPCQERGKPSYHVFIVGNPPFLGDKTMIGNLTEEYVTRLRRLFHGRVPGAADLVCFWFEKARTLIADGRVKRAGLVATNSIRGGANRTVLDHIRASGTIFEAWSDEPWRQDGAAVRVSLVCFGPKGIGETPQLNGHNTPEIFADLTGGGVDLTTALRLTENAGVCFEGGQKYGEFDISGNQAREWLKSPLNVNERPNADVIRPYLNAMDLVRRSSDRWIIDFGVKRPVREAAFFELPFQWVLENVKPYRDTIRRQIHKTNWWIHGWPRPELRAATEGLKRFIVTPVVAKYRIFAWTPSMVWPSNLLDIIARDDDTTFGILHSRFHELWSLRQCTWLGKGNDPRYTPSTTFETFPFPYGLTPDRPASSYADNPHAQAIAAAARHLNDRREAWLNPADLVERAPEVVPGFPDRLLPRSPEAAAKLKKLTLTNLYNKMPDWLRMAHRDLDAAVAAAYGWPADLSDEEALRRLLALNHLRATPRRPAQKRRFHWSDPRQIELLFRPQQLAMRLDGGAGEAPEMRPKAPRRQTEPERRQRHLPLVISGGLRARVHETIVSSAEAA